MSTSHVLLVSRAGTLNEAAHRPTRYLNLQDDQSSRDYSIGLVRPGDIRTAQGNLAAALDAYQAALDIRDALAKADPDNTEWQRDLIVSQVQLAEAGGDAANHYRQALGNAERLKTDGKLAPVDAFIPGILRERSKAARGSRLVQERPPPSSS